MGVVGKRDGWMETSFLAHFGVTCSELSGSRVGIKPPNWNEIIQRGFNEKSYQFTSMLWMMSRKSGSILRLTEVKRWGVDKSSQLLDRI